MRRILLYMVGLIGIAMPTLSQVQAQPLPAVQGQVPVNTGLPVPGSPPGELLTPEQFLEQVKAYHPVSQQARLISQRAAAGLLSARGGFDPTAEWNTSDKTLGGVDYYRYSNPELKIPTLIGIDVKGGFENSRGQYKNPELTTGVASYLGVEVPLLSGLLMDKRRAILRQAKIYVNQGAQEQRAMLNDLFYDSYYAYYDWAGAYQLYNILNTYLAIAEKRNRLVQVAFQQGDRSVADTVEATAQLQAIALMQSEALMELNNKAIALSVFLWNDQGEPYLISDRYRPAVERLMDVPVLPDSSQLLTQVTQQHPVLQATQFKLQSLEVERRLKLQYLLPKLNVKANMLSKDYFQFNGLSAQYLENNNKFGISFKMPLLLREGRGEYQLAKIKIQDANLELDRKQWELQNKLRQYYNQSVQLENQLRTATSMFASYQSLLNTEELKFQQGESSLFLINTRQSKALEMQEKVISLQVKRQQLVYGLQWAAGVLE